MSKISIYEVAPVPKLADKLVGTSVGGDPEDITYNFTLSELLNLFIPNIPGNTLQGVLDFGNTATQDIILNGTIFTTYLEVTDTATILDSFLTGETHITGGLYDRLNSVGTAGQVLRSTGTQVEWYSVPTVIPDLQQVLTSGNTAVNNIILTGNLSANNAALLTSTISTSLTLLGTLRDGLSSVGANNQVLSSNVTGVRWVNLPVYSATSPLLYNSGTGVFSIQQANASQNGYLSSADWITFDGKQTAISLTTTGNSGASTLVGATINVPNYTLSGLGGVPQTRTLTINGVTYNLSADRSWTLATGVSSVSATTPLFSTGGVNPDISIQKADSSLDGYLSSADWLTFNSKQPAGNYITSLTGEATGVGPGATAVTLSTTAVTGKLLTGLNLAAGGTISATDSILIAFGKTQNQISALLGGVIFKGVWNANTNTPTLVSSVGTQGWYYIVNVAGTTNLNGITDWQVGDWAIFNGTVWDKVDNTDAVSSVNGFTGAVSLTTDNIPEGSTNLYYTNTRARAALSFAAGSGAYNNTTGVITIPTNNNQITNGANYITLASLSAVSPLSYINTTGVFSIQVANTSQDGYLSSTDWNTFNNKQATITLTTTGSSGASTLIGNTLNIPNYANLVTSVFGRIGAVVATEGDYSLTQLSDVTITTPSSGQVLKYNGTAWVNDIDTDTGITSLNGLTALTQTFAVGTSGTDFAISSVTSTHTFNLPTASVSNRGALSSADWTTFNNKQGTITLTTTGTSGAATFVSNTLNIPQYQSVLTNPITGTGTSGQVAYFNGTSSITSNAAFAFTPTSQLLVNNSVTAASAIARGTNLTPTLVAAANSDVLVGLDINPTFTNGAFTGVKNYGLRVGSLFNVDVANLSLNLINESAGTANRGIAIFQNNNGIQAAAMQLNKSRGTNASPTAVASGDIIGAISFRPYVASSYVLDRALFGTNMATSTGVGMFLIAGSTDSNYNPSIYIHPTSNVVIGSSQSIISGITDTGFKLDVNGTARIQDNLTVSKNINAQTSIILSNTTGGTNSQANFYLNSEVSSGSFSFGKYSSTTSTYKIVTASNAYLYNITAGDIAILNDFASGGIKFAAGGSSTVQARIFANGNFGINQNTDAGYKLDVNGTARVQGILEVTTAISRVQIYSTNNSQNTAVQLFAKGASGTQSGAGLYYVGNESPTARFLSLSADNTNYLFNVYYNGNVSIGTNPTDAGYKLDVNGTARVQDLVHLNNASGGQIRMWTSTANNSGIYGINSSSTGIYGNAHIQFDLFIRSTGSGIKKFGQSSLGNTNNICITNNNTSLEPIMITTTDSGAVGIMKSTSTIPASAVFEIESTTKGFLPPRMTSAQRTAISSPATGLIVYQTDGVEGLWLNTSTGWRELTVV